MTNPFAALAAAAGAAAPMSSGTYNTGRTLYIDGDGLAYYCAGNDEATTETARENLHAFIRQAKDRAGAEFVRILVTASGSSKGDRFAIARAKPYQGQRADARRPKNWAYLRLLLEAAEVAGATTEHLRDESAVVPDPTDRATIEEEHALELRTRDRERKLLKKIEQSIVRIDAGDYGYCDETGEAIGVGRLLARPTATLSLEAQQRRELKQKMFGD